MSRVTQIRCIVQVPWTNAALTPGDIFWTRTRGEERKHWAHRHQHSTEIIKQEGKKRQLKWGGVSRCDAQILRAALAVTVKPSAVMFPISVKPLRWQLSRTLSCMVWTHSVWPTLCNRRSKPVPPSPQHQEQRTESRSRSKATKSIIWPRCCSVRRFWSYLQQNWDFNSYLILPYLKWALGCVAEEYQLPRKYIQGLEKAPKLGQKK